MLVLRWFADETLLQGVVHRVPILGLVAIIVVCVVFLSKGADWLIDGIVNLARRTGLPRIVISATIVSLGTTTPEAVVSVMAAWMGNPGLALGNGVGSIIADTGLIFGLTAMLTVVPINRYILNRTGWVQVGSASLLVLISLLTLVLSQGTPMLNRWIGAIFLALLAGYMYVTYYWARRGSHIAAEGENIDESEALSLLKSWIMIAGGLFCVVIGARILVPSAAEIAFRIGVPEDVVAATMVALGTSLPELMTAIAAIRKGHPEIMVGNVIGADVLNCLFVIGASSVARPLAIPMNFFYFHFPAMILILYSFRIFIFADRNNRFRRWQGAWLFGIYIVYIVLQYAFNVGVAAE